MNYLLELLKTSYRYSASNAFVDKYRTAVLGVSEFSLDQSFPF